MTVSTVREHLRGQGERQQKGIASYILEFVPVVSYSRRLWLNEEERVTHIRDSMPHVYPLRSEAPAANGGHAMHTDPTALVARANEHDEGKAVKSFGMPEYNIEIPSKEHASQDRQRSGTNPEPLSCSVCTEDFFESDNVRILPCGHIHHQSCIDPWLLDFAGTCPLW